MRQPDIQAVLKQHMRASRCCKLWIERQLKYEDAGLKLKAREARKKAENHMLRAVRIEARYKRSPFD